MLERPEVGFSADDECSLDFLPVKSVESLLIEHRFLYLLKLEQGGVLDLEYLDLVFVLPSLELSILP